MQLLKTELENGHFYLGQVQRGKTYNITLKHDAMSRFIVEILDEKGGRILYRPNKFDANCLPNIPYTLKFHAPVNGELAIHYDANKLDAFPWTKVYDLALEEVK